MSFLDNLSWRYATRKFDTTKKVSKETLDKILGAIQMTPTSYGLQPYHFYIVSNQATKDQIQVAAKNQPQVGSSSHIIVFTVRTDLLKNKDEHLEHMSGGDSVLRESLKGYEDMLTGFLGSQDENNMLLWASKQVYIAHGFALAACAELQIDSCPMEGFDSKAVGDIVGIPENQRVLIMLPIGYRDETDIQRPKVRFPKESLFTSL